MKHSITAVAGVVILVGGAVLAAQQAPPAAPKQAAPKVEAAVVKAPAGPAGKWILNLESPQGAMTITLDVKIDADNKVTGTLDGPSGPSPIKGEVKDGVLGFTFAFDAGGTAMEIYVEGKINAEDKLMGTMSVGDMGAFPFSGTRVKGL